MVKFDFSFYKNLQFFFKVIDFLEYTRFASRGYIHDALLESSVLVHTLRAKMESHPSLSLYPFSLLPSPHYLPTYPIGLPSLPSPLAHTATHLAYYETRLWQLPPFYPCHASITEYHYTLIDHIQ